MAVNDALLKAYSSPGERRDSKTEATFLHAAAQACRWRLGASHFDVPAHSYAWVHAQTAAGDAIIVLQHEGQVAAFATRDPMPPSGYLTFEDRPDFVAAAAGVFWPIRFLSPAELCQPLGNEDLDFLRSLGAGMAYDIKRWNPQTVGEVIFNWWD
jgi:hypothetical protein